MTAAVRWMSELGGAELVGEEWSGDGSVPRGRPAHLRLCGAHDRAEDALTALVQASATPVGLVPPGVLADPPSSSVRLLRRAGSAESAAPVRLTRRGLVVLTSAVVALGVALLWWAAQAAAHSAETATVGPGVRGPAFVVVQSGDTVWSIADRVAPQRDPQDEVSDLERLNRLREAAIVPGQVLRVR